MTIVAFDQREPEIPHLMLTEAIKAANETAGRRHEPPISTEAIKAGLVAAIKWQHNNK